MPSIRVGHLPTLTTSKTQPITNGEKLVPKDKALSGETLDKEKYKELRIPNIKSLNGEIFKYQSAEWRNLLPDMVSHFEKNG